MTHSIIIFFAKILHVFLMKLVFNTPGIKKQTNIVKYPIALDHSEYVSDKGCSVAEIKTSLK